MSRTGHVALINKRQPHPCVEIHPRDAKKCGIEDEQWVELQSARGSARFVAKVTTAIAPWYRLCSNALGSTMGQKL